MSKISALLFFITIFNAISNFAMNDDAKRNFLISNDTDHDLQVLISQGRVSLLTSDLKKGTVVIIQYSKKGGQLFLSFTDELSNNNFVDIDAKELLDDEKLNIIFEAKKYKLMKCRIFKEFKQSINY